MNFGPLVKTADNESKNENENVTLLHSKNEIFA